MAHMDAAEPATMKKADSLAVGGGDGEEVNEEMKKSNSRFQVARVDYVNESETKDSPKHTDENNACDPPDSPATFSISGDSFKESYTDSHNMKTFAMNTHEALPCVDHYRNILSATAGMPKSRPTLAQLHEEMDDDDARGAGRHKDPLLKGDERPICDTNVHVTGEKKPVQVATKFGWIKGVLIRCLLNIWGVMLFIRLSWVVGQAGMALTGVIIILSGVVTTLTALSMSAICTNGEVKGGGAYYMISRSLGAEFGGAIGLIFSVANAVAIAMYVVGFAETVRDLLKVNDALMIDETNDIRIIGFITITMLLVIALVGMDWEARAQLILLGVLVIALINFAVGCFIPPSEDKRVRGYVGFKTDLFMENMLPAFQEDQEFFSVFSVFFPAATGILAGANISGDLKDAQVSIPKGTLLAILISTIVYLAVAATLGGCMLRDAVGYVAIHPTVVSAVVGIPNITSSTTTLTSLAMSELAANVSGPGLVYTESVIRNCSLGVGGTCQYGLLKDYQAMEMMSGFGPLITAGIFSATLSSALASLVSAPKVFQAVCKDEIFPKIKYFAKGYGIDDNPRRAYILAYFIGLGFVCIGDLNAIAPVISNFFLMSYTLINYSCFDAKLIRSPGWRPAFRFYNKWCSLLGALICLAVMFIIKWWTALITFGVISALFIYVHHTKPEVNWGSSTQAHVYRNALQSSLKLISVEDHIKNFRPQMLVLSGLPETRPALVDFVSHITKKISLMVCANVIVGQQGDNLKKLTSSAVYSWLNKRRVKAFYTATTAPSFRNGVQSIMHTTGIGKLRPNTLIMGFKSDWRKCDPLAVQEYFHIIHDAFDLHYGVGLLRLQEGFGIDIDLDTAYVPDGYTDDDRILSFPRRRPEVSDDDLTPEDTPPHVLHKSCERIDNHSSLLVRNKSGGDLQNGPSRSHEVLNIEVLKGINMFKRHPKKGTIDVWWLFDDGGLTLLIPYILTTKAHWRGCKLRVFTAGTKKGELDREQRQMATLLSKFRIECKDMTVLPDVSKSPKEESKMEFENIVSNWVLNEKAGETAEKFPWKTSQEEMTLLKDKTNRHIRLRELMKEKSKDASLIVMTLPMPRKSTCSAGLYMAWIDTLTRDMPPILLLRGNQTSVLTFYS